MNATRAAEPVVVTQRDHQVASHVGERTFLVKSLTAVA